MVMYVLSALLLFIHLELDGLTFGGKGWQLPRGPLFSKKGCSHHDSRSCRQNSFAILHRCYGPRIKRCVNYAVVTTNNLIVDIAQKHDVFISYAHTDMQFARKLRMELERNCIKW